jgi:hypothetical protein
VAFAASEEFAGLDDGWPALRDALVSVGLEPSVVFWDDPDVAWDAYGIVVSMFMWGYVTRRGPFLSWAEKVGASTRLVNPAPVLEWNSEKTYLADLAGVGIPTVPTQWVPPGGEWEPPGEDYVIKPSVGSGGLGAARYVTGTVEMADRHVRKLHEDGATVMVQPYQPTIESGGETDLVFLGGRYSHGIRKGALLDADVGVTGRLWERQVISAVEPRDDQLAVAGSVMTMVEDRFGPTGFGRVDLVDGSDGVPRVLELELVEPSLFLRYSPGAAGRLAAYLGSLT